MVRRTLFAGDCLDLSPLARGHVAIEMTMDRWMVLEDKPSDGPDTAASLMSANQRTCPEKWRGLTGVWIMDKPSGITSLDVLRRLKKKTGFIRMGHAGTLDPLATGVLPVLLGEATKLVSFMELEPKRYRGSFRLGVETDSWDITGNVIREESSPCSSYDLLSDMIPEMKGKQVLAPPLFSAIKHKGKPLYSYARQGKHVEVAPREVTIDSFELLGGDGRDFFFELVCSRGTYVRSVVHAMGVRLGCGACLLTLRRLQCGRFSIDMAWSLEQMEGMLECGNARDALIPAEDVIRAFDLCSVDGENERRIRNGNPLRQEVLNDVGFQAERVGQKVLVMTKGLLIAVAEVQEDVCGFFLQPVRVLNREQ